MISQIKTFKVICDLCQRTEIIHSNLSYCNLPKDWGTKDVHNCGMTDYTRIDHLCPECLKKLPGDK